MTSEDGRINQLAGDNGAIIDHLLKERGLTREQIAEKVLEDRIAAEQERQRKIEEEQRLANAIQERARLEMAADALRTRLVMLVDGKQVSGDDLLLGGLRCPRCKQASDNLKDCAVIFAERSRNLKVTTFAFYGKDNVREDLELSMGPYRMAGPLTCRHCGEGMEVLLSAGQPAPAEASGKRAGRASRKMIDST